MGWLAGWAKRIKITIDHNDVDASLSHFPVLLYLSSSSGITGVDVTPIFDEVGANSKKIAVTKSDGTTQLYVEIEKWDSVNEKAWLWISRSGWDISSIVDTDIYIYYDNTKADNNAWIGTQGLAGRDGPRENVWDAHFMMVQHMCDAASPLRDSTSHDNDATEHGTLTYQQVGKINHAIDFPGSDDYFTVSRDNSIEPAHLTLEAWFYADTLHNARIFAKDYTSHTDPYYSYQLGLRDPPDNDFWNVVVPVAYANANILMTIATYAATTWTYTAMTFDGTNLKHYKNDGAPESNVKAVVIAYHATDLYIGARKNGLEYDFNGKLDELRISDCARSAAWVKASYESGRDHFVTYGSEEIIVKAKPSSIIPLMKVLDFLQTKPFSKHFPKFKPRLVA